MKKREFYRRRLPHLQMPGQIFFVTWSLKEVGIRHLYKNYKAEKKSKSDKNLSAISPFTKYDKIFLTDFSIIPSLTNPQLAEIIAKSIHHWDKIRIDLYCYSIMSDHVHIIFKLFEKDENRKTLYLQDIMKSIKNYSARKCNEILHRKGQFWQHESYDRLVRNRNELFNIISYVLDNPVKAGLCEKRKDWPWSYINPEYNEFT